MMKIVIILEYYYLTLLVSDINFAFSNLDYAYIAFINIYRVTQVQIRLCWKVSWNVITMFRVTSINVSLPTYTDDIFSFFQVLLFQWYSHITIYAVKKIYPWYNKTICKIWNWSKMIWAMYGYGWPPNTMLSTKHRFKTLESCIRQFWVD